jgi:hypothetical protein
MKACRFALLVLLAARVTSGQYCPDGPKTTTKDVVIVFNGCTPSSANIRWFDRKGTFKGGFTYPNDRAPLGYRFYPPVIMMSSSLGLGCMAGVARVEDGRCVAKYVFPCAERRYRVAVEMIPPVDYAIEREVSGKARICSERIEPRKPVGEIGSDERVAIFLYGTEKRDLLAVTLPTFDLASTPPEGMSLSYGSEELAALIKANVHGQSSAGSSHNGDDIAEQLQKKNAAKSVKVVIRKAP